MIKCIIADDEKIILDELCLLISNTGTKIVGAYQDPYEALEDIASKKPDAVFLDIEMPGMNGIELARKISKLYPLVQIVFATAYERYALQAFEVAAIHYMLKPMTQEKVDSAIERIERVCRMNTIQGEVGKPMDTDAGHRNYGKIIVKERNDVIILKTADILYLKSENGKALIVTKNGSYKSQSGLSIWESRLKKSGFVRCHRSFIVNSAYIMRMIHILGDYKELVLDYCDVNIPISRQKVSKVKDILGIY